MIGALLWVLAGALVGGSVTVWLSRRGARPLTPTPPGEGPPLLEWILRANGATGAWLIGPGTREVAVPRHGISEDLDRVVRARLEHVRMGDSQGVERLGTGTLVYASLDGRAAGLQLPTDSPTGVRAAAQRDLARLLDYDRWRPVLARVVRDQDTPLESVESVAMRLAIQLERALGVETCVALPWSAGVEIAGVSLRSDKRLLHALVERGSVLEQVALGQREAQSGVIAPFGMVRADRRKRPDPAYVCPIPGEKQPVGAIAVWTVDGTEPTHDLAAFRGAIEPAGPRLAAAMERRALEEAAARDPLTGLRNRRGFSEVMTVIGDPSGALIYADIDHFKKVNDELGHPAGDAALVHMSRILLQAVRNDDTVARIGGEEFAIWLPVASLDRGREVAERIRQSLSYSDWNWQGRKWRLTASFGVAACPETGTTREALPAQADAALYAAKRAGRDRVAVAGAPHPSPPAAG
ncbi:MAG TPA: GGDEF domain-containing protein [Gemmatimonadales bacterium]|nr:GGDEF domain-containing protein [Gemmatimonadales bacterium]